MPGRPEPLLCELHALTTWSDGSLSLRQLADLYEAGGFDVLAVTDHVIRRDDPWFEPAAGARRHVHAGNHAAYLEELDAEAERRSSGTGCSSCPGSSSRWSEEAAWAATVIDRFELVNRHEVFGWVAAAQLPVIASGDFHQLPHFATWKTLLACERTPEAVVQYLRSSAAAALTRVDRTPDAASLAA